MIEFVFEDRCTACGKCVERCPTNVFDAGPNGLPVIARQEECDGCLLCEAHCDADALFVAPLRYPAAEQFDPRRLAESGILGNYRRALGFDTHAIGSYAYCGPEIEGGLYGRHRDPNDPNAKVYEVLAEAQRRMLVRPSEGDE